MPSRPFTPLSAALLLGRLMGSRGHSQGPGDLGSAVRPPQVPALISCVTVGKCLGLSEPWCPVCQTQDRRNYSYCCRGLNRQNLTECPGPRSPGQTVALQSERGTLEETRFLFGGILPALMPLEIRRLPDALPGLGCQYTA